MTEYRLLVVDDADDERELLAEALRSEGYAVSEAVDGQDAWERLEADPDQVDVVLLDRRMPRMTGLELLAKLKAHPTLKKVPVVLQTGRGTREDILEGIAAGAYYYLTKPVDTVMLSSIVKTAASDFAEYRSLQEEVRKGIGTLTLLQEGRFEFRSLDEAKNLATFIANACPEPEKVVIGLTELLINALEHGNLGISYEEKSKLKEDGNWVEEVCRRVDLPENADKRVAVNFLRNGQEIQIRIRDQGDGFDWRPFLQIDPTRAFDCHGRGIAMANLISFDRIEYMGPGNEVLAVIEY